MLATSETSVNHLKKSRIIFFIIVTYWQSMARFCKNDFFKWTQSIDKNKQKTNQTKNEGWYFLREVSVLICFLHFLLVYSLETSFWVTLIISLIIGCCFWIVVGIL